MFVSVRVRTFCLAILALLLVQSQAYAASICLTGATPAGGCASTVSTIATALTNAVEGDTIYLHAGTTYTGHWTLPDKIMTGAGITIATDTATANLPASTARAIMAHTAFMPIVQSDSTSNAAFTAARGATSAAERYTFLGIWFKNNPGGFANVISLGTNDCDVSFCQEFASQEPDRITIDRCVFTADPVVGQKRFVEFGGTNLTVKNSSFFGAAGLGQDAQCIGGINGHGPWTITNNYCEASTENILIGGDDARIRTVMTVSASPAATTTTATVSVSIGSISGAAHTMAEVAVGDHLAILISAGTARCHTTLRSKSGSGASSIAITFDACAAAPDTPGDIRAGVTVKGLSVRRNHLTKPLTWLSPIINAPTNVNVTPSTSSGTLAAGTYSYTLVALNKNGYQGQTEYSNSQALTCALSATGKCTVSWTEPTNASHYQVYGRASSGVTQYWEVAAGTTSFDDTGTAGAAATSVPKASYWQLKNLFEIKGAQSVQVDSNVLEYQWAGSDNGGGIWIKSNNQSNGAEFNWSKDIVIEKNIFRHVDGCLVVSGQEPNSGSHADDPGLLTNLTFRNNLCYDSGAAWALSKGGAVGATYAVQLNNSSANTILDHNTFTHNARGFVYIASGIHTGLQITNNLALKNGLGIFCDTYGEGAVNGCARAPSWVATANAIAGISTSIYPAGNFGPSVTQWQSEFVNYTQDGSANANGGADYHLLTTSTYHNLGTDQADIGANIDAVLTSTAGVTAGAAESGNVAPSITTTSLPNGTVGSAYTASVSAQGVGAITFALVSGSLPAGLSMASSGAITGTPTTAATSSFTVQATDGTTALTAQVALSIIVNAALTNVAISSSSPLTTAVLGQAYSFTLATSGGRTPFAWSVTSGTLPSGLALDAITGAITGTPLTTGTSSFTVTVAGAIGTPGSKAFTLLVSPETMPSGRSRRYNTFFEAATFLRTTCPVDGTVRKGDVCSDVSAANARLRIATTLTPSVTWADVSAVATSHNLLSATHSDTFVETPADGDMLVYGDGAWRRVPIGPAGTVWGSDGTSVGWIPAAAGATTSTTYVFHTRVATSTVWTNMEAATLEFVGTAASPAIGHRVLANLVGKSSARLYARVSVPGASGAKIWVQYSTDEVTWVDLDTTGGATVTLNPNGNKTTSAFTIDPAARRLVYMRIVGSGGDGVADPSFGQIQLEVEP